MSITVLIPAYNEEKNLANAAAGVMSALADYRDAYEIIILNANSHDQTGKIADELAAANPKIRVIHRTEWAGLGANYMAGVRAARMDYFVMFPGDNENSWQSLAQAIALAGKADIIISYTLNMEVRAWHRRVISNAFVWLLNLMFGLNLKYYNGNAVYPVRLLQGLEIKSRDFAYNAEILTKLIRSGCSYTEFGIQIQPTSKTAIFSLNNVIGVIRTIALLFYDVRIKNQGNYQKIGTAVA
jgi:glycosyltransferase involved in cell wall biosynthesis